MFVHPPDKLPVGLAWPSRPAREILLSPQPEIIMGVGSENLVPYRQCSFLKIAICAHFQTMLILITDDNADSDADADVDADADSVTLPLVV